MERFYNKNTLCYKNIKKSGDVFSFCHKRMQPTALGAKNQIKWKLKRKEREKYVYNEQEV